MLEQDILNIIESDKKTKPDSIPSTLTILPLRDTVIYPHMIFPVLIGRSSSLKAVADALERDKTIFVSAQKDPTIDEPTFDDIYEYGTIAKIIQILRLPNNLLKVLVEGMLQARIVKRSAKKECLEAEISVIDVKYPKNEKELEAMVRHNSDLFREYVKLSGNLPQDVITAFDNISDPVRKLFFAAANINQKVEIKQRILEQTTLEAQYFELSSIISNELELIKIESEIDSRIQSTIAKNQRIFYIQEQIRALQKELGEEEELSPELIKIKEDIENANMPEAVYNKAIEEFERLKKTPSMSPEYSVNRTYLEFLTAVPWQQKTEDNFDIEHVKRILDEDHYDLEKPKERILEYIAVLNLAGSLKRQILCFVGPPGVGKTSLGRSIARALGRRFVRFSLGGVRDEAEIRGHRRTYIGALPGKIIQAMKKAGTINPVILLDEIDKMSMDFRGDPSSALLEVLDPEQNVAFNDHYLEVDYDLSNVLFITTANVQYEIPLPLQDRMEIIHLNSYLDPEKIEIAKNHIIPKLIKEYGLDKFNIFFSDEALLKLIRDYTREAGVRNLEREIASILRKLAKDLVQSFHKKRRRKKAISEQPKVLNENPEFMNSFAVKKFIVDEKLVEKYLKTPIYKGKTSDLSDKIGTATGLAWTSVGGDILPVEVSIMSGSEKLTLTGKLGDVMQESAKASLSYVRANAKSLGIREDFFKNKDIHIHVPEGAIPKDGPSAGITITLALISAATGLPIRGDIAMTGEITLRGNILPIGGLNEKLLAAKRNGILTVIIPKDNERDIQDINKLVKKDLKLIPVKHINEAIKVAFRKSSLSKKVS